MIELLKVYLWRIVNFPKIKLRYLKSKSQRTALNLLNSIETIEYIINNKSSISRFGDGEFQMVDHYLNGGNKDDFYVDSFQDFDQELGDRLDKILSSNLESHLVCIPYAFKDSSISRLGARIFWEREWNTRRHLFNNIDSSYLYGDTNFTRFYMDRLDIKNYANYIACLKKIWDKQDVLIVEGEMSRLGVGNDLFDNTNDIKRVLCPIKNAFSVYKHILDSAIIYGHGKLILIALGHTATVLAHDLAEQGYWAIDIGHIDIEYEWYRMQAREKVAVANKYVNEVSDGRLIVAMANEKYEKQIVDVINVN